MVKTVRKLNQIERCIEEFFATYLMTMCHTIIVKILLHEGR